MKYYHATPMENLTSISTEGIRLSPDGVVYLCTKPEDCLKFALVHGVTNVLVLEVNIPANWVIETFDHSETFFKCRCWGSTRAIPTNRIKNYIKYDLAAAAKKLNA